MRPLGNFPLKTTPPPLLTRGYPVERRVDTRSRAETRIARSGDGCSAAALPLSLSLSRAILFCIPRDAPPRSRTCLHVHAAPYTRRVHEEQRQFTTAREARTRLASLSSLSNFLLFSFPDVFIQSLLARAALSALLFCRAFSDTLHPRAYARILSRAACDISVTQSSRMNSGGCARPRACSGSDNSRAKLCQLSA